MPPRKTKVSLLRDLKRVDKTGQCVWRFQPKGASLRHESIPYSVEGPRTGGVWAFVTLENALRDLHDQYDGDGYATEIREEGKVPELVAICGANIEDGPEAFVIAHGGKITARFLANKVKRDSSVTRWLHKEGVIE